MTVATVQAVCERFLKSTNPEVMAIKGAWGVGKTYAWGKIVKANRQSTGLKNYCYVSLFGIPSITQLALAILTKAHPFELEGTKLNFQTINEQWFPLAQGAAKKLMNFSRSVEIPYAKNVSLGLEQLAPSLIADTVICLDDFERNSKIPPEEILGFISYLREERGCKIVLVFNEERLGQKEDVYRQYREKVIDIELLFAPSSEEAVALAFPADLPHRDTAEQCARALGISNIRVLRKIVALLELISPTLASLDPSIMKQAVTTMVLLSWAYYDAGENKPDVNFILRWNSYAAAFDAKKKAEEDPRIEKWSAVLRTYGLLCIDEFDLALSKVIEHGHIEETGLVDAAVALDAAHKANNLENSFSKAWNLFHYSLENNQDELVTSLQSSFKHAYKHISPMNLNSTARLLRQLGHADIADDLINFYVANRADETGLFDLDDYPFAGDIDDPYLIDSFKKAFVNKRQLPTLLEAVLSISKNRGWSREQIQVIENATVDEYCKLFLENQGEDLPRIIKTCLQFQTIGGLESLANKPKEALQRIGKLSDLNELRVRRMGILITSQEPIVTAHPQGETPEVITPKADSSE